MISTIGFGCPLKRLSAWPIFLLSVDILYPQGVHCVELNSARGRSCWWCPPSTFWVGVLHFARAGHCAISLFLAICKSFFKFLDAFMDMSEEYIKLPGNVVGLNRVNQLYTLVGLPGACGSMDVVHIKWSSCPAGDYNWANGKEGYPTLGFQVITDFKRCILGVYGPQFGTANNKHIVKMDSNVKKIRLGWFKDVWWGYTQRTVVLDMKEVCI